MATITVRGEKLENFLEWSYTEDITGRDPNTHTGGSGQVSFSVLNTPTTQLFLDNALTLTTPLGTVQGTVRAYNSGAPGIATLSADDIMLQLKKYVVARAQVNRTLTQILSYLRGLLGNTITMTTTVTKTMTMTGFEGNFYDRFKEFLSAKGLAMQATATGIKVTDVHALPVQVNMDNMTDHNISHSLQDSSRKVEVGYYQHRPITNAQIYPLDYSNLGDSIQLETGEILEVIYDVNATLTSVNQPVCVWADDIVGPYDGTNGVYAVIGGDTGTDIAPSWWNSNGGMVEVEINPDSTSILVRITAPDSELYSPYTITADPEMSWTGIYITGTGAYHKYEPVTITTGASAAATNEDIGDTVDNIFIGSATEAYNAGFFTAAAANMTTGRSITALSTTFGSLLGKQVNYQDANYRIESVTHGADNLDIIALDSSTSSRDFDAVFSGLTAAQMGTQYAGLTALDVSLQPLKRI